MRILDFLLPWLCWLDFSSLMTTHALSSSSVMRPSSASSSSSLSHSPHSKRSSATTPTTNDSNNNIQSYQQAFDIIDACAISRQATADLYPAVRFLEDHAAAEYYADETAQQALWHRAHGSFELVLSTGKTLVDFHVPPAFLPFSYAMIDDQHFGNGVGQTKKQNGPQIWISLLHKHTYNPTTRQLVVTLQDVFWRGRKVTDKVPAWVRRKLGVGKRYPEDFPTDAPPTFTLVGASDTCLVARGNQSGGLAIWTRLPFDIRPLAYQQPE